MERYIDRIKYIVDRKKNVYILFIYTSINRKIERNRNTKRNRKEYQIYIYIDYLSQTKYGYCMQFLHGVNSQLV